MRLDRGLLSLSLNLVFAPLSGVRRLSIRSDYRYGVGVPAAAPNFRGSALFDCCTRLDDSRNVLSRGEIILADRKI